MKNIRKTSGILLCLLACLCALSACGKEEANEPFTYRAPAAKQEEKKADTEEDTRDFVIEQMDMVGETMTYTLGTRFMDKYGDSYSSIHFTPGQVVQLGDITAASALSSVQMSDQVWNQTDVTNYKIDTEKGIFTIGQTQYRITSNTMAFSRDAGVSLDTIGTDDTLQVIGKDKEVWSVIVTTGHGYIQLQNSSTFVDSMICIGNRIFTRITGDMLLEVPEGTYAITVANKGYGGTGTYTVARGETTTVDLDQLKGSGPKVCQLTVTSDVAGASVYIDGQQITVGQAVPVTYGSHTLKVVAEGYDDWQKTLIVNSESATISLDLEESESTTGDTQSEEDTSTSSDSGKSTTSSGSSSSNNSSNSGKSTGSTGKSSSSKSSSSRDSDSSSSSSLTDTDYLTTISKMLSTLLDEN